MMKVSNKKTLNNLRNLFIDLDECNNASVSSNMNTRQSTSCTLCPNRQKKEIKPDAVITNASLPGWEFQYVATNRPNEQIAKREFNIPKELHILIVCGRTVFISNGHGK